MSDFRNIERECDKLWGKVIHSLFSELCGLCKCNNILGAHHIIFRRFKLFRHDVLNGILLCDNCHKQVHQLPANDYSYLLADHVLNQIGFEYQAHYQHVTGANLQFDELSPVSLKDYYAKARECLRTFEM